jgi:flagellar hook-basal body complex protein FliE
MNPLGSIQNPAVEQLLKQADSTVIGPKSTHQSDKDFSEMLMDTLKEVNASQQNAAEKQGAFMAGQKVDYHDLMIAVEKASISMQLTMAVRNKVLEGYSEISRMQI